MFQIRSVIVALLAWFGLASHAAVDIDQLKSDTAGAMAYATLLVAPSPVPTPGPAGLPPQIAPQPAPKVKPAPLTQPMRVPYYSPRWRRR